jgi:hypothetical protein
MANVASMNSWKANWWSYWCDGRWATRWRGQLSGVSECHNAWSTGILWCIFFLDIRHWICPTLSFTTSKSSFKNLFDKSFRSSYSLDLFAWLTSYDVDEELLSSVRLIFTMVSD